MSRKSRHQYILDKAKAAAFAAISCYNQPMFTYREESFSILMVNAWELLLQAKIVEESNQLKSIFKNYKITELQNGKEVVKHKVKRSYFNNPITINFRDILKEIGKLNLNLDPILMKQLDTLYEIRNSNIHHARTDIGLINLEVFTATLYSFKLMLKQWFKEDISDKLMLIPVAFNLPDHFNAEVTSNEAKKLLEFIERQERSITKDTDHSIRMNVEVTFKRSQNGIHVKKSKDGVPIVVKEDEIFQKKYYWSYKIHLIPALKKYSNFKADRAFRKTLEELKKDPNYCRKRPLNLHKKDGVSQWYYSPNIIEPIVEELGLKK